MEFSKFLSNGKSEYFIYVNNGRAINIDSSGAYVLFEDTSLFDGIYNQDGETPSDEVRTAYEHYLLYSPTQDERTAKDVVDEIMGEINDASFSPDSLCALNGVPKITKSLAQGLDKTDEVMTFIEDGNNYEFVCFGTRKPIVDYLEAQNKKTFTVNPMLYYDATNFKGIFYVKLLSEQSILIVSEDKVMGSILFGVDIDVHDKFKKGE